jgi:hypothetical protein
VHPKSRLNKWFAVTAPPGVIRPGAASTCL